MKKNKILEYYEGNPDTIVDNSNNDKVIANYMDSDAIAFGYFPVDLYGSYEFLIGGDMHIILASEACNKLVGKAKYHISEDYFDFLLNQCYDKAYGMGRYWEDSGIIAFWSLPTEKILKDVVLKLNISLENYIVVQENDADENITIREYLNRYCRYYAEDDETEAKEKTFRIDPKVKDIIDRYNEPEKSWQVQKEKSGWDTIAQRNAMLYQESKERIDEYYTGDPDTIYRFDDESCEQVESINFRDPGVLSFGYFQTELGGEKEFMYSIDKGHHEMAEECAKKFIGKASDKLGRDDKIELAGFIYSNSAYKGRIFLKHHVITSWSDFSSKTLADILSKIEGGVERFKDWIYLTDWDKENNVEHYISLNAKGDEEYEAGRLKTPVEMYLPSGLIETIKQFNTSDSSWAAEKEKSGWKSLAQRNAMIYQEEEEPKQTIKENNKDMKNKINEEFSNYLQIMSEALNKRDFAVYDAAKEMLEETVQDCKHEKELADQLNTNNFGILNHIFEERLPELFKSNKRAVKNVIKTIREDKNLLSQFNYYNAIRQYKGKIAEKISPDMIMSKLNEAIVATINKNTVIESNNKFRKVLKENNIIPNDFIDDEMKELYESGHNILTKKNGAISNVMVIAESSENVKKYMDKHKTDPVNEAVDPDQLIKEYKEKLKDTLTESEMSFVQQITDWRSPIAEQRKEKLFNKFKNECIDKINEMLKEDAENVELKGLSDQINEMSFNKDTIVKDIAKLLEIRDILLDE
jgi:hypothetical protein